MKKRFTHVLMICLVMITVSVFVKAETSESDQYEEALHMIALGDTEEGLTMLSQLSDYPDAEHVLEGYQYLEYYLGEWEADLEDDDCELGTTVYPEKMKFTVGDDGLWMDEEINGFQRLRFPVTVDYTMVIYGQTKTETEKYDGYLLFEENDDDSPDCIIFGIEVGGIWYCLWEKEANRVKVSFSVTDSANDIDTDANNFFPCNRITERQETDYSWDGDNGSSYGDSSLGLSERDDSFDDVYSGSSSLNIGDSEALKKALSYLGFMAFSKTGLIEQLEYEGFSHSEALAAVESCGADWNEQALLKAKSYLDVTSFSYDGLVSQLEFEGFTSTEAKYGADNCGADWNEQAVKKAEDYLKYSAFSKSDLISQLEFEGFTYSQALYGVSQAY